jgi:hypothetical protein
MDKHLYTAMRKEWEEAPPLKSFTPKCKNLEILEDYSGTQDLGEEYWSKWDKKDYHERNGSMVDHEALERVATRLGYKDMKKVKYICNFLEHGASLGIEGEGRMPSLGPNNATCYEFGSRVADSFSVGH